jgi:hypothetical protein
MLQPGKYRWFLGGVIAPFLVTRAALLIVGWFSRLFPMAPGYHNQDVYARGVEFTSWPLLDIWGRWDTAWYLSIVKHGYSAAGEIGSVQSNVVFFPLYPLLVKVAAALVPSGRLSDGEILLIGVIVSNLLLIGAMALLYKVVLHLFEDGERLAKTAVWYVLLAPAGFFRSAFYTESTFLFFSLAAFLAALRGRWALACVFGMLLSACRPLGGVIGLPILILYMESIRWRVKDVRLSILWLGLVPLGCLAFFTYMQLQFGDFLAPLRGQGAWAHELYTPWNAFFDPTVCYNEKIMVDRAVCLAALALSFASLFTLRSRAFGAYALFLILVPLSGGTLNGASRYCLVIFPVFLQLALLGRKYAWLDHTVRYVMLAVQVLLFIAWCRFYEVI